MSRKTGTVAALPAVAETGRVIGILYLENSLVSHVFTGADRGAEAARLTGGDSHWKTLVCTATSRNARRNPAPGRRQHHRDLISSRTGRIIEANDAFLRMVGYDREDLAAATCAGRI